MPEIIDVSFSCGKQARNLFAAGVRTVIRYYTRDSPPSSDKRLSRAEAEQLARAGLRLCVVHEGRRGNDIHNFDHPTGLKDGTHSRTYAAHTIGQPGGSAIYFGIDTDASGPAIRERVIPYFEGVNEALADTTGEPNYRIGVYGSGAVCEALLAAGLVELTWLSQSTGWARYDEFLASGRWTMRQEMGANVAGVDCDPDVANGGAAIGDFVLVYASIVPAGQVRYVIARSGLRLRAGPGTDFEALRLLPFGTAVHPAKSTDAWTLVDLQGDGAADGYVSSGFLADTSGANQPFFPAGTLTTDVPNEASGRTSISVATISDRACIPKLVEQGSTEAGLAAARRTAQQALQGYPHNGCAAHLSALLQQAGIDVVMTLGAGKLAWRLEQRGWRRVRVGEQQSGDVGVAFDNTPPEGADHVYLVVQVLDGDKMMVADNQNGDLNEPHERYATAGHGKTATDYFLRAT